MNLLQKAIIKKITTETGEEKLKNEQLALKEGSQQLEEALKNIIEVSEQCYNTNIAKAKLLLNALKDGQEYTDEQIKKALMGDFAYMAHYLWLHGHLKENFEEEIRTVVYAINDITVLK